MNEYITLSTKRHIERCQICGKFIADNDLGLTAHKLSNNYTSDFAHDTCMKKLESGEISAKDATC
jgi:hypothetical protein